MRFYGGRWHLPQYSGERQQRPAAADHASVVWTVADDVAIGAEYGILQSDSVHINFEDRGVLVHKVIENQISGEAARAVTGLVRDKPLFPLLFSNFLADLPYGVSTTARLPVKRLKAPRIFALDALTAALDNFTVPS